MMSWRLATIAAVACALLAAPALATWAGEPFYLDVARRIMIMAIAATSLNILVFHAGMTSFGHAVYLGIGSYAVAVASSYGLNDGFMHLLIALCASAAFSFLVGCIAVRVTGTTFIMITLAFAQLVYFLVVSLKTIGGDDGLMLKTRSRFGPISLNDDTAFYFLTYFLLALALLAASRLTTSKFGRVLSGIRQNEKRMQSLGYSTRKYKIVAFVIAGSLCGVAGALLANQSDFASPDAMHWSRSGDLLVMVVLGGAGSVFGPLIGASLYILIELLLSGVTSHWHLIFGPALVAYAVYFGPGGVRERRSARGRSVRSAAERRRRVLGEVRP